ncbi:TetR family transcriptional regulator C-terminal domain-containing protein [Cupriavidus sp. 30B13]|uniref:TetR/AcrR family transcriptional regulator n=1 Tax=Cupriavidus sp. 30B13 TaxID=3384241 RepID=UPI003B8FF26E
MPKPSHRDKILSEGLKVVHARGYAGASVRDIVQAAGVPQGSFTNHFTSKEAFGLEVLNLYFGFTLEAVQATLRNDYLPPLQRLRAYLNFVKSRLQGENLRNGCLMGNFSAEVVDQSETIRQRLIEIFAELQRAHAHCLKAAVAAGEVPPALDCEATAELIVSYLEGAFLMSKVQRSVAPIEHFEHMLFSVILR